MGGGGGLRYKEGEVRLGVNPLGKSNGPVQQGSETPILNIDLFLLSHPKIWKAPAFKLPMDNSYKWYMVFFRLSYKAHYRSMIKIKHIVT